MQFHLHTDLPIYVAGNIADWHARQALRAGRKGQPGLKEEFEDKMYAVITNQLYPRLVTQELVRHIGRSKAMVLKIDRDLINLAL